MLFFRPWRCVAHSWMAIFAICRISAMPAVRAISIVSMRRHTNSTSTFPKPLARTRNESYAAYAWPSAFSRMFARNGLATSVVTTLSVAIFIIGFVAANDPSVLFSAPAGDESFYRLMPHRAMALLFGGAFAYAVIAMVMGFRQFWRSSNQSSSPRAAPRLHMASYSRRRKTALSGRRW